MSTNMITMMGTLRSMGQQLLTIMLSYWVLCVPLVMFSIDKIIKLIRKLY